MYMWCVHKCRKWDLLDRKPTATSNHWCRNSNYLKNSTKLRGSPYWPSGTLIGIFRKIQEFRAREENDSAQISLSLNSVAFFPDLSKVRGSPYWPSGTSIGIFRKIQEFRAREENDSAQISLFVLSEFFPWSIASAKLSKFPKYTDHLGKGQNSQFWRPSESSIMRNFDVISSAICHWNVIFPVISRWYEA